MRDSFNWLHLTDLHYGQPGQNPLWPNIREAFFKDLRRVHERCGPWDAVLFTGDLVFSGQRDEFERMQRDVLDRLWAELRELGSGGAVLLAVPGNHDLARPPGKPAATLRQLIRDGGFEEISEEFWSDTSGEYARAVHGAFEHYTNWWTNTPDRARAMVNDGLLPGDFAATIETEGRSIGVVGLNTTFLQLTGDEYEGRLVWDTRQLHAVCHDVVDWTARHDACLLLTHQGPTWLTPAARKAYSEIYPAGRFAAHLFGHMHETNLSGVSQGGGIPVRGWQGMSICGMEKFGNPPKLDRRHGYGAGRIDFSDEGVFIRYWPRSATCDANGWRLFADHTRGVLEQDEGTPPERLALRTTVKSPRPTGDPAPPRTPSAAASAALLAAYMKAARDLWDIIDLARLPEGDRAIAMQRFVLRQLYISLRLKLEPRVGSGISDIPAIRSDHGHFPASRIAMPDGQVTGDDRVSLGEWLSSALQEAEPSGIGEKLIAGEPRAAPRLVILGDPGGGKSTLLRWLATACVLRLEGSAELALLPDADSLPNKDWIPVMIRCRDLDKSSVTGSSLHDLLRQTLPKLELYPAQVDGLINLLAQRIEEGRAMLLIDGLDEIADMNARSAFCDRIEVIAKRYHRAPILATSRIVGYREMRRRIGERFAHATLAELTPEQKDDFIVRWCEVTIADKGRGATEAESLRLGIHGNDRIERLTTNPMLLTTMALVQRKVGRLPSRRHRLYWEAVDLLLRWRTPEGEPIMETEEALPQLAYLSYVMCERGVQRLRRDEVLALFEAMRNDYPNVRPVQRQSPESFLAQLERRTALLMEVGEEDHNGQPVGVYEFRHLTFQEYLAAQALIRGCFPGHRAGVSLADRVRPIAGRLERASGSPEQDFTVAESWREPLRLCTAMSNDDDVDSVLEAIATSLRPEEVRPRITLAALCLADEPNVSEALARNILAQFVGQLTIDDTSNTGSLERAGLELAHSTWSEALQAILMKEFFIRPPFDRLVCVWVMGLVQFTRVSTASELERRAWLDGMHARLQSGSPTEVVASASAIVYASEAGKVEVPRDFIPSLMRHLSGERAVATAAAVTLATIAAKLKSEAPAFDDIGPYFRTDADADFLMGMLWLTASWGYKQALPEAVAQLFHGERWVKTKALEAIEQLGEAAHIVHVVPLFADPLLEVRESAVSAYAKLCNDDTDARLLSRDFDKIVPWLDPRDPVPVARIQQAAERLNLPESVARERYESLARRTGIKLEWEAATTGDTNDPATTDAGTQMN